jgi:PAS domain S-box-containing protein
VIGTAFIRRMVLLASALLLIAILQVLPERDFQRARDAEHMVEHTLRVLRASQLLLATMEAAEAGQRGYLLTGNNRYLDPYESALSNQGAARQNLRQLTADNSRQQSRIASLDRLVEARLSGLSRTIALYRTEGQGAALVAVATDEGRRIMDDIRDLVGDLEQEEYGLLSVRTKAAEAKANRMRWVVSALLMIMLAAGGVVSERDIRIHARDREALRNNEERFRTLANAIPQLCWMANADGGIFWYNQRWYDFTGATPNEMVGWGWQTVHDPEALPAILASWKKAIAEGLPWEMVFRLRAADGAFHPFLTRVMPLRDQTGEVVRWFGTNTDITAQRLTEEALAENQERLRLAQQVARIGTFVWNLQTGVSQLTPELEAMYGLPPGGFAEGKRSWQDLICPEDRDQGERYVQEVMETGSFAAEWRVTWPDGTTRWLFGRAWVSKDDTGKPLRLMGANTDVTERKLAELEVRRINAALAENQERLRLAQQVARIGTFVWNLQTGESQLTPELEAMYGLPPGGFAEGKRSWQDLICPEDRDQGERYVQQAMETGSFAAEWRVTWPDGATRWLFGRAWVSKDDTGKPLRLMGANTDVTERKNAELEVLRMNAGLEQRVRERTLQLETANQELEAFAYSVSHDLRAPLRGIDGWSLALMEDYSASLDDGARQYLNRVRAETQRMGILIDDLLQLSRVNRGEMKAAPVDLTTLANRIIAGLRDAHPKRSMEFAVAPELTAFGDGRLLEIALTNLFSNAVKFTGARDKAFIEFGSLEKEGEMVFYVRDNGAGFDMAYAGNLFGAFQRLHRVSEFPGTGVGLATVQRIVHRHGGRVWADAGVNRGATFSFTLGASS